MGIDHDPSPPRDPSPSVASQLSHHAGGTKTGRGGHRREVHPEHQTRSPHLCWPQLPKECRRADCQCWPISRELRACASQSAESTVPANQQRAQYQMGQISRELSASQSAHNQVPLCTNQQKAQCQCAPICRQPGASVDQSSENCHPEPIRKNPAPGRPSGDSPAQVGHQERGSEHPVAPSQAQGQVTVGREGDEGEGQVDMQDSKGPKQGLLEPRAQQVGTAGRGSARPCRTRSPGTNNPSAQLHTELGHGG